METRIVVDSGTAKIKAANEDDVINTSSTSAIIGITRGKAKFVMGFMTTQRISEGDGYILAKKFLADSDL